MAIKYKGRSFHSGQALANAMKRDINQSIERKIRRSGQFVGGKGSQDFKKFRS